MYNWSAPWVSAHRCRVSIFALSVIAGELMTNSRFSRHEAERYAARGAPAAVNIFVGVLAGLLGILALWILIAELASPRLSYFPSSPDEANAMYAVRGSATTAAEFGIVRGDLWTGAAVAAATPLLFAATGSSPEQASQVEVGNMRALAEHAARLSPHDPRIWLVLAGLDFRGGDNSKGTETLKLSYYTGPEEVSLMPLRLLIAVSSSAILDDEVQSLVPLDVQRIIKQRPDLKSAIALAYKNAQPKGREIIEAALRETDPNFLAAIVAPHRGNQIPN